MAKAIYLTEILPTREQFEITGHAAWQHLQLANAPEEIIGFYKAPSQVGLVLDLPLIKCWRETHTIPELFDDEPISFLIIEDGVNRWAFGKELFFRVDVVEAPVVLP